MKKEALYCDTSVISAYYDQRAQERQAATIRFWEDTLPHYKAYISEITVYELENTKDAALKKKFKRLIKGFSMLKMHDKAEALASMYIDGGVFPAKYIDDARHVAVATYHAIPYVVSWNFEHLVKVKTRRNVNRINVLAGYKEIEIISPQEL